MCIFMCAPLSKTLHTISPQIMSRTETLLCTARESVRRCSTTPSLQPLNPNSQSCVLHRCRKGKTQGSLIDWEPRASRHINSSLSFVNSLSRFKQKSLISSNLTPYLETEGMVTHTMTSTQPTSQLDLLWNSRSTRGGLFQQVCQLNSTLKRRAASH